MTDGTFTVVRERDSWLVVGPLATDASRVLARCDDRRDAETLVLLLNVPFDDLLGVVRAVAELGAEDDLSLVRIRSSVVGLGATAARWLTRAESIAAPDAGRLATDRNDPPPSASA